MPRLFAAIEPAAEVLNTIREAQATLRRGLAGEPIRWQHPGQAHLTLHFLGNVPEHDLPAVARAIQGACRHSRPIELKTAGFGTFPRVAQPSILWLGVAGDLGELSALERRLSFLLTGLSSTKPKGRFTPHFTLGRVRRLEGGTRERVAAALTLSSPKSVRWTATEVALIESRLRPEGAEHRVRMRANLAS